jgi:hypothetical protein
VSCLRCHHGVGGPYPGHTGKAPHNDPADCDGCHGADFNGAAFDGLAVPSCFECHVDRVSMKAGFPDDGACGKSGCHPDLQSHPSHTESYPDHKRGNNRGPSPPLECEVCHTQNPFIYDVYADGNDLMRTVVCNQCHSPGGAFDGVDGPILGAKGNWDVGVYVSDLQLRPGKENWCLGCHDDDPNTMDNEAAFIDGVYAPNIAGDENNGDTYGFNITGHGAAGTVKCLDCHDAGKNHIDGIPRTYELTESIPPVVIHDYTDSYRLMDINGQPAMNIPRLSGGNSPQDFALCVGCHAATDLLSSAVSGTNFWNDDGSPLNAHFLHLGFTALDFDSDWDGAADSRQSCVACHNVHGPPNRAMIRHGELISTYGTMDKVPALNFAYTVPATPPWATATWTPTITTAGDYYVYARWSSYTNRATNAMYTVNYNGSSATHLVNQQINGDQWNMLGSVQYNFAAGTSGNVVLSIEGADGQVIADAVGFDSDGVFGADPEIVIDDPSATFFGTWLFATGQGYGGSVHYHDKPAPPPDPSATLAQSVGGRMSYAGGSVSLNGVCQACHGPISYERTPNLSPKVINAKVTPDAVANDGSGSTLITASVYDPDSDFSGNIVVDLSPIGGSASQAMNDSGSNGDATAGDGVYSYLATVAASTPDIPAELVITATDGAANTGDGQVLLFVVEPGAIYIDNPEAEFFGTWLFASGQGYGGSVRYRNAGTGSATATWRPDIPSAGNYKVYAWWSTYYNRATDAPYTVNYDGNSQTFYVNQQINGGQWNQLGGTFPFAAGTSGTVVLSDDANGQVIADAIKFEPQP